MWTSPESRLSGGRKETGIEENQDATCKGGSVERGLARAEAGTRPRRTSEAVASVSAVGTEILPTLSRRWGRGSRGTSQPRRAAAPAGTCRPRSLSQRAPRTSPAGWLRREHPVVCTAGPAGRPGHSGRRGRTCWPCFSVGANRDQRGTEESDGAQRVPRRCSRETAEGSMWHVTMRHDRLVGVPFGESPVLQRGPDGQSARKDPACRVTSRTDKATRADGARTTCLGGRPAAPTAPWSSCVSPRFSLGNKLHYFKVKTWKHLVLCGNLWIFCRTFQTCLTLNTCAIDSILS